MKKMRYFTSFLLMLAMVLTTVLGGISAKAEDVSATEGKLLNLKLEDSAWWMDDNWSFDANTYNYDLTAWLETYGVRFTPEVVGGGSVEVTMSGTQIEETTSTVKSGEQIVLNLSQKRHSSNPEGTGERGIEEDCTYKVVIKTTTDETYTLNIKRPGLQQYVDKFERCTFDMNGIEGAEADKTMTYWKYVPEDYDGTSPIPVVLYLHGVGQRAVEATDVLLRNAGATTFPYYGKNCIVIAPQCNYSDLSATDMWGNSDMDLSVFGKGAYAILQDIKANYNVDTDREYVVGLSMGGHGTCAMVANYPDEWAAAMVNAAPISPTEKGVEKMIEGFSKVPTWFAYATDDNSVAYDKSHDILMPALDAAGVDYKITVVTEDQYLAPMRHFVWAIQWANEDVIDWLLSQKKEDTVSVGKLTGLKLEDSAHWMDSKWAFDANTNEYNLDAWLETYGIRFTPEVEGDGSVEVTMSGTQIEETTTTVKSGEQFILNLTQKRHSSNPAGTGDRGIEEDCTYKVVIKSADETYTLNIKRPGLQQYVDMFERCAFNMDGIEGAESGKTMTYWKYVPKNYDASKKYPVVLYLHGIGQRAVEATDVLLRNAAATTFPYYGKECIVIAPQCNYSDLSTEAQWADGDMKLSQFGEGAYQIIQQMKKDYSIDANREYVVGLSMGGQGTCGMISSYPDEWAGAMINAAPYATTEEGLAKLVSAIGKIPTWLAYATNDESVKYEISHEVLIPALDKAGVDYKCTVVTDDEYLAPMRHFVWAIQWANENVIDWLLSQKKESSDIVPAVKVGTTKITSLKAGKKAFKVKYKKISGAKYQVAYKLKGKKWKTVKTSATTKVVKKLKAKKTYYVKVRAYKSVNGKTVYGAWSKAKKVKTK